MVVLVELAMVDVVLVELAMADVVLVVVVLVVMLLVVMGGMMSSVLSSLSSGRKVMGRSMMAVCA